MDKNKPSVPFISSLVLLITLLVPSIVFAYDIEYYTYGGFVPMEQTFKRIALIFSDTSYKGLAFVVLVASILCSGAASFMKGVAGGKSGGPFAWFIPLILGGIMYIAFFTHTGTVNLYDAVLNKTAVIAGIPDGITFLAGTTNRIKRGFVDIIDTAGGVNTPSYKSSGTGIGFDLSSRMINISPASVAADETVANYTKDCVLFEIARSGTTLTPDKIYNSSTDIVTTLAEAQNPAVMTTSALDASGNPVSPAEPVSCTVSYNRFKPFFSNSANLASAYSSICGQVGYDASGSGLCKDRITEVLNKEAGAGSCSIDSDKFLSNFMISQAVHREIGMSSGMASMVVNNASAAKNGIGSWTNLTEWMPFMRAILLVIQISLIPILSLFIASPFGKKAIAIIVGFFIFDMAWEITDALIYGVSTDYFITYFQNCASNQGLSFYLQFPDASTKVLSALGTARVASFGFATLLSGLFMGATNSALGSVAGSFKPYEDPINAKGGMFTPGEKEGYSARMASVQATASNMNKFGFGATTDSMTNKGASDLGSGSGFGPGGSGQANAYKFGQTGTQKNVVEQQAAVRAAGGAAGYLMQRAQSAHTTQQKDMGTVADWQSYMKDAKQSGLTEDQAIAFGGMFMKGKDASSSLHATTGKNDGDLAKATGLNAEERKEFRSAVQSMMDTGDMSALNANEKFKQAWQKLGGKDTPNQSVQNGVSTLQSLGNDIAKNDFNAISNSAPKLAAMGALLKKDPQSLEPSDMKAAGKALQTMVQQQERFAAIDQKVQSTKVQGSAGQQDTRSTQAVMQELRGNLEKGNWENISKDTAQMAAMGALVGVSASQVTKDHMGAAKQELTAANSHSAKMDQLSSAIQSAPSGQQGQPAPKRDEKAVQADLQKNLQSGNFAAIKADPQQAAAMAALTGKDAGSLSKDDMAKANDKLSTMSGSQEMQSRVSSAIQSAPLGQQGQQAPKRDEKAVQADLQKNLQAGNFAAIKADPQQAAAMAALTGKDAGSLSKDDMAKANDKLSTMSGSQEMQSRVSSAIQSAPLGQQGQQAPKRDEKAVQADLQKNLQSGNFAAIKADPQQAAAMAALTGKDAGSLSKDDMAKANDKLSTMSGSQEMQSRVSSAIQSAPSGQQGQPAPKRDEKAVQADLQKNLQSGNFAAIKADPQQVAAMAALTGKDAGSLSKDDMAKANDKLSTMSGSQEMQSRVSSAIQSAPLGQQGQQAPKRDEKAVQADLQKNLQSGNFAAIKADPQQAAAMAALTGKDAGSLSKDDMAKANDKLSTMSGSQEMQSRVSSAIQSAPSGQQGQPAPKRDEKAVQADLQKNLQSGNFAAIKADPQQAAAMAALTGKDAGSLNKDDMAKASEELNAGLSSDSRKNQVEQSIKSAQQQPSQSQQRDTSAVMSALQENLQSQDFSAIKNDPQQLAAMGELLGKDPGKLTADDMPLANKAMIDMKDGQKQINNAFEAVDKATPAQANNPEQVKSNAQGVLGKLDTLESFGVGDMRRSLVDADTLSKHQGLVSADAERSRLTALQNLIPGASTNNSMALNSNKGVTLNDDQAVAAQAAGNKGMHSGFTYSNPVISNGQVAAADVQGVVSSENIGQLRENLVSSNQPELAAGLKEGMMVRGTIDPHTGKGTWAAEQGASVRDSNSLLSESHTKQSITGADLMKQRDVFGPSTQKWLDRQSKQEGFADKQYQIETSRAVDGKPGQAATVKINSGSEATTVDFASSRTGRHDDYKNLTTSTVGTDIQRVDKNLDIVDKGLRSTIGTFMKSGYENQELNVTRKTGAYTLPVKDPNTGAVKDTLVQGDLYYGKNEKTGQLEQIGGSFTNSVDQSVIMFTKDKDGAMHYAKVQGSVDSKGQMVTGKTSAITEQEFLQNVGNTGNAIVNTKMEGGTVGNIHADGGVKADLTNTLTFGNRVESQHTLAGGYANDEFKEGRSVNAGGVAENIAMVENTFAKTAEKVGQASTIAAPVRSAHQAHKTVEKETARAAEKISDIGKQKTQQKIQQGISRTSKILQNQSKNSPLPKGSGPARGQVRR